MSDPPHAGLWSVLPAPLRVALGIALATSLAATGVLFQGTGGGEAPSDIVEGPGLAPSLNNGAGLAASPTPTSPGRADSRSQAVLSAPEDDPSRDPAEQVREGFPTFGRYIYEVDGYEQATAFGRRDLPPEMTMIVDRSSDTATPPLAADEVRFDLVFSQERSERAIVAYRPDGVSFTYESLDANFGPVERSTRVTYAPAMLQVPPNLEDLEEDPEEDLEVEGSSTATATDGSQHVEDWSVTVEGTDRLQVFGRSTQVWVIKAERATRPGSDERVQRERTYWYDPSRAIWVKWKERMTSTEDVGPSNIVYVTDYTATLARAEPL